MHFNNHPGPASVWGFLCDRADTNILLESVRFGLNQTDSREYLKRPLAIPPQVVENAAYADVAKLVDARDLKSLGAICTGSTPVVRTNNNGLCPLFPVLSLSLFSAARCLCSIAALILNIRKLVFTKN